MQLETRKKELKTEILVLYWLNLKFVLLILISNMSKMPTKHKCNLTQRTQKKTKHRGTQNKTLKAIETLRIQRTR
jgi:uncharacterized transporter YbjL